jgi:glycolate oxidase iron-sulfur subunit
MRSNDMKRLVEDLMRLDDLLVCCMRCAFCQAVCPVYGATMKEADVARGKISLLENLAHEMIKDPLAVNEKLNRCLLCGSCQANCPSGVDIMDIFLRARSIVAGYLGLSPIKKIILRGLLKRPKLFNTLTDFVGKYQKLFLKSVNTTVGTCRSPILEPFIGDRHFPALAKEPFHTKVNALNSPAEAGGIKVAFFPGCVSDKLFPQVAEAAIKALSKHGVGIYMPEGQSCCGVPALAAGDRKTYDDLVKQNLQLFGNVELDYLITPCATCTATIKEFWPKQAEYYTAQEKVQIEKLHDKVMDITAFFVDVLKADLPETAGGSKIITYHDSCHMKKSLGVSGQPRKILKALPGYRLVDMLEPDRCCGSGGSFTLYHYDLSKKIGQRKRDNIVSVNPDVVAVGCPACMMQLMDILSRNGDNISVKHVIELYAETL